MNPGADLWMRAASFSARAHAGQTRKDGRTPYAAHPARTAMIVRDVFGCTDPAAIAAAFLHDTIEDTPADYDEIADHFGHEIAAIVAALTKAMFLPEDERERDYDARLAAADWRARLVKLADVLDNAADLATRPDADAPSVRARGDDKARRAVALARSDAASHPEIARAIEAVEALRP
jgi:guanosine-3',5'-bis(diphosphate) 3'-pyrophosphohydrolase